MSVFRKSESHPEPAPYRTPRPLTAAAQPLNLSNKMQAKAFKDASRKKSEPTSWQAQAWGYYDSIGEINYAFNMIASVVSRVRLFPATNMNPAQAPTEIDLEQPVGGIDQRLLEHATRAVQRLDSSMGGMPSLLRAAALNLSVVGECYLVQIPERVGSGLPESWDIRSIDELLVLEDDSYVVLPSGSGGKRITSASNLPGDAIRLPPNAFAGRIWRPHPRASAEADASLRSLLDLCIAEGTPIFTPDGMRPIETIRSGDEVYARDPQTGHLTRATVEEAHSNGVQPVYKVQTRGRSIRATGNHPILTMTFGDGPIDTYTTPRLEYKNVEDLQVKDMIVVTVNPESTRRGDYYLTASQRAQDLMPLDGAFVLAAVQSVEEDGEAEVFDLQVPGPNNFIANGIVVHNCGELLLLNQTFQATARSRLGAGALLVPDGLAAAHQVDGDTGLSQYAGVEGEDPFANDIYQGQQGDGEDEFEQELIDSMLAPIEDPSSPAAVVPLLIRGPAEALQAVRHVKIDRAFEESQVARSDRVLERILQGLDVPKDVVTGLANVKYCLTPDAEAFTRRAGWTAYTDILEGDQILTLNPENGQVEFQAPSEVTAFEYDSKEDGPMTKIESEGHRSISTRDHRWPVWAFDSETTGRQGEVEILTSADLVAGDIIIRPETPTDDAPLNGVMIGEGDITQVEYKGDVWCPTTPNGTWLARDKETGTIFFTGNTNSITIDETLYKTHIEPLLLLLSDALTKVYLHPALRDMEFSEDEIRKVVLWYDPSGINTRSDRAADADAGYDKFAISADAWRSAHNFGDDDAPTEEEIAFRMLTGKGIITPEMTEALLALYAPDVIAKMRAAAQASSPAPVPDEVEQMLDGGTPAPGAPAAPGADMAPPPGLAEPGGGISEPAATDADPAEAPTEEEFEDADPPEEVPTAPAP